MSKKVKYAEPQSCANCGGIHYGSPSGYCPYIKAACVVCGTLTIYACSDCAIDNGGEKSVHVCEKVECQRKHEKLHPDRKPQDLAPDRGAAPSTEEK